MRRFFRGGVEGRRSCHWKFPQRLQILDRKRHRRNSFTWNTLPSSQRTTSSLCDSGFFRLPVLFSGFGFAFTAVDMDVFFKLFAICFGTVLLLSKFGYFKRMKVGKCIRSKPNCIKKFTLHCCLQRWSLELWKCFE